MEGLIFGILRYCTIDDTRNESYVLKKQLP